jgi:hypothetical protein
MISSSDSMLEKDLRDIINSNSSKKSEDAVSDDSEISLQVFKKETPMKAILAQK